MSRKIENAKKVVVTPRDRRDPSLRPYVVNGIRYYRLTGSGDFVQSGKAASYGRGFNGRLAESRRN